MSEPMELDLAELRRMWQTRRARAERVLQRFDTRGMTRPARNPDERAWLAGRGAESVFVEDRVAAERARAYYERRYRR